MAKSSSPRREAELLLKQARAGGFEAVVARKDTTAYILADASPWVSRSLGKLHAELEAFLGCKVKIVTSAAQISKDPLILRGLELGGVIRSVE